jgi:transposase
LRDSRLQVAHESTALSGSHYQASGFAGGHDFRKFLDTIEEAVPPDLDLHLILDNYGTHKTPLIQRWLAKRPRYHLHFTPTGASWMNLVERWFAVLTEKQLRRGVHRSTRELELAIERYLEITNEQPNHSNGRRPQTESLPS